MIKNKIPFIPIALILLIAIAWGSSRYVAAPVVAVVQPTRGEAVQAVYATGTVEASVMLPIAARAPARLMELNGDEGDKVQKGQLLARLENDDLQHTIAEQQAREQFARSEYQRKSKLTAQGFGSKEAAEQAKADWSAATAATRAAQSQAGYLTLIAPDSGKIIKRDGEIGELIAVNQPVFWLATNAPLRISAEVDEEDIAEVKPGQKVVIRADAFPGKIFHGTVESITPKGDPVARSYRVRITFDAPTPLMIGMTAETNIIIRTDANALLLPASCVEQGHVWLVRDGKLVKQPVVTGAAGEAKVEIQSGLDSGSEVALSPSDTLKEGERVRARKASEAVLKAAGKPDADKAPH